MVLATVVTTGKSEVVAMCEDKFANAKFYDARDREILSVQDPEEEIVEYFDGESLHGQELLDKIAEDCPLTVNAMNPREITDEMIAHCAEQAMERATEALIEDFEEYWSPDGDDTVLKKEDVDKATAAVTEILRELFTKVKVWGCEVVATRDYSAQEVEAILRRDQPDWFKEETDGPG
jgi:transcriptional regulator of met regulon